MLLRRSIACAFVACGIALAAPTASRAVPVRGSIPWDFIACSFSDTTFEPYSNANLQARLLSSNAGSLADWISTVSYGAANLGGVTIHGYYTIHETSAQAVAAEKNQGRPTVYNSCKSAASSGNGEGAFSSSNGRGLSVITWPEIDTYGGVGFSMDGAEQPVGEFAHEFGHGLGLNHSWSNDAQETLNGHGDYDNQWDEMSFADVTSATSIPDNQYGGGPGLDGYHLDSLGWLPMNRVKTFGADGVTKGSVTLAPLNDPSAPGYLLVRIPIDPSNPLHYMTVEYVKPSGYYSGIPGPLVQINEVDQIGNVLIREGVAGATSGGYYTTILERTKGTDPANGGGAPDNFYHGSNYSIQVTSGSGTSATVSISDTAVSKSFAGTVYGPNTCTRGYVWRGVDNIDYVCVSPDVRSRVIADNAAASRHHKSGSSDCIQGYVWRGAFQSDHVCVTPDQRSQAEQDNANTGSRYVIPLDSNT